MMKLQCSQIHKFLAMEPRRTNAQRVNASDLQAAWALALADLEAQRFGAARDLLTRLLQKSNDPQFREMLGLSQEGLGNLDAAAEQFRLAAESAPNESSYFAWGASLLFLGRAEQADHVFAKAMIQFPGATALALGRGAALYNSGQTGEAVKSFLKASTANPSDPAPYMFIAGIFAGASNQDTGAAIAGLTKSLKREPASAAANYAYACVLFRGRESDATPSGSSVIESYLKRAIALKPAFAEAHFKLAALYSESGQYARAIPQYRKVIEMNPAMIEAHYRLGQAYIHTGHKKTAERELNLYLKLKKQRGNSPWQAISHYAGCSR